MRESWGDKGNVIGSSREEGWYAEAMSRGEWYFFKAVARSHSGARMRQEWRHVRCGGEL